MHIDLRVSLGTLALAAACIGCSSDAAAQIQLGNPYEKVNWQTFSPSLQQGTVKILQRPVLSAM